MQERRWRVRNEPTTVWKQTEEGFFISGNNGYSWEVPRGILTEETFQDVARYEETFDHLPSLPEKEPNVTNQCPMDVCLAPKRLALLEDFYEEVQRILSDVDGSARVQAALSNALRKVDHA